jgi:hypothetical protein
VSRRQLLIFALVGLSAGLSWYFVMQGRPTGPNPRASCLTTADCESSELCVIVPKGDGFATFGQCGERCTTDDGCPNGWTCRAWVEEKGYLLPDRGQGAEVPRVKACAHHTVK